MIKHVRISTLSNLLLLALWTGLGVGGFNSKLTSAQNQQFNMCGFTTWSQACINLYNHLDRAAAQQILGAEAEPCRQVTAISLHGACSACKRAWRWSEATALLEITRRGCGGCGERAWPLRLCRGRQSHVFLGQGVCVGIKRAWPPGWGAFDLSLFGLSKLTSCETKWFPAFAVMGFTLKGQKAWTIAGFAFDAPQAANTQPFI